MWELAHKEGWTLKNWYFQTMVLEKTLKSPLDSKKIKPVNPKGYQHWIFTWKINAEAEAPIFWPSDAKSWLTGKDTDAGREGLGTGEEGDNREWNGWMASPTRWTWVWVNSRSWWQTGMPGVLRFMGLQRVGHDWATELNWMVTKSFTNIKPLNPHHTVTEQISKCFLICTAAIQCLQTILHIGYYKIMPIIPCAVQYILVAYLFCIWWFVSVNHITPVLSHPTSLSPLVTTSVFSTSLSLFLFCTYIWFVLFLNSTYKWYFTEFAFPCLTHFTKHNIL